MPEKPGKLLGFRCSTALLADSAKWRRKMVGAVRFELTTSCTRNKRASQATLRPDSGQEKVPIDGTIGKQFIAPRQPFIASQRFFEPQRPTLLEKGDRELNLRLFRPLPPRAPPNPR